MPHNIASRKKREADILTIIQHFGHLSQAGLDVFWQVNLGNVTGDHRSRTETDTCQEHFNLLDRGILCLVENDKGIIQATATHKCQRRNFNHVTLDQLCNPVDTQHFIECVIQGA